MLFAVVRFDDFDAHVKFRFDPNFLEASLALALRPPFWWHEGE
jgi:hypothetical protein